MPSMWRWVAYYALPVPLVLMVLLALPLPRVVRKGVLEFTQRVFGLPLVGAFRLLHVMLFLTGMAFLQALRALKTLRDQEAVAVWPTANSELTFLSKRWRAERNSWIAAFAFTMWMVLSVFYREVARQVRLEDRLEALQRQAEPAARPAAAGARREEPAGAGEAKPGRVVAAPPAPVEPAAATAGIQMQELKKEL